ncbi:MAG: hypothetical protein M0R03_17000 [Novosphingobium sp.]|nr:hypothetical protein [Novosphingobium sp.]
MNKHKCECGKLATWCYMPNDSVGYKCDDCVPRGCTCNQYPIDDDYDNLNLDNWIAQLDDEGRLLPCCEWWYDEEGWDK